MTQAIRKMRTANPNLQVLTVACISANDGDDTVFDPIPLDMSEILGWYIREVRTIPDAVTPPTNEYDIVIEDEDEFDVMGGTLADRSDTNIERALPLWSVGEYAPVPIYGDLTIKITGNSVSDAETTIKIFLVKM